MNVRKNLILMTAVLTCAAAISSCRDLTEHSDDVLLASVGHAELHASEIAGLLPQDLSGADSVQYVAACVDRWIVKQLKVQEAEALFSSSAPDIDRQVEEYRQSLLVHKIEQYYLDNEMTEITDEEIEAYYNEHKSDFHLDRMVVKGTIVSFGDRFRQRDRLIETMRPDRPALQQEFRDLCIKNNFPLYEFTEWTDFADFLDLLPTVSSENYDALTRKSGVQRMTADGIHYCFVITAVLNKGDIQPLELSRDMIRRILETQRSGEIIRSHEAQLVGSEEAKNRVKRYFDEE